VRNVTQDLPADSRTLSTPPDVLIGVIVGIAIGGATSLVGCWYIRRLDLAVIAAIIGCAFGAAFGGVMGWRHLRKRRDPYDTNLGVTICTFLPLVPSMALFGFAPAMPAKMLLACVFALPLVGMVIGAAVDRFYEAFLRSRGPQA
jgi:hypothetical protein